MARFFGHGFSVYVVATRMARGNRHLGAMDRAGGTCEHHTRTAISKILEWWLGVEVEKGITGDFLGQDEFHAFPFTSGFLPSFEDAKAEVIQEPTVSSVSLHTNSDNGKCFRHPAQKVPL